MGLFVEGGEGFLAVGAADDDGGFGVGIFVEEVVIEGMEWLAGFHEHVVRDIDHVIDGAHADFFEGVDEPIGAGSDLYTGDDAGDVPGAEVGGIEANVDQVGGLGGICGGLRLCLRQAEWIAGDGGDFTGDTDDAIEVGSVGGDFEIEDGVAGGAAEVLGEGLADFGVGFEDEEAVGIGGEAEFFWGAHHAVGFDPADFADLNCEGFFVGLGGGEGGTG